MKITVPLMRDITMLMLGAGVLTREFFLIGDRAPDRFRVYVGIALLMGPTFILGVWQAWVALRAQQYAPQQSSITAGSRAPTRVGDSSSSPPSSSPSPPL